MITIKLRSVVLVIVGFVAIGLSISCFSFKELDYESISHYGGDAYTGIQNAAARTSKNVKELTDLVKFGFGSVLLVTGLGLIGVGITTTAGRKEENNIQQKPIERNRAKDILASEEKTVEESTPSSV